MSNAPFFSQAELASIRETVSAGLQSSVLIQRLQNYETPVGISSRYVDNATVMGWVFSTPTPMITLVSGAQVLVNTYRLYVAVGTDIQTGDHVVIGAETYTVSDTTAESTWLPLTSVTLRKIE